MDASVSPQRDGRSVETRESVLTRFARGDQVRLKASPDRGGVISTVHQDPNGSIQYDVFISVDEVRTYPENALLRVEELNAPVGPTDQLKRWRLGSAEQFRGFLTLAKLTSPITDNLYSFLASRTELLAYQFKPVLKLIESPYPRLLISDEVGLGKTIEAGIILTELNARMQLNRVLVVCPSSLMNKWRSELRERFDLDFEIYDGPSLRKELDELGRLGEATPFRGIASLELLRRAENIEAFDKAKPRLDLVIVDEAHHMRNRGTMSNALGDYLSSLSEAMVFLTATPLNLGQTDFFELLHLLVPEEFNDFESFQRLLEPNEPINESLRILRRQWPPDYAEAAEALRKVEETSQGPRYSRNVRYGEALRRLDQASNNEVDREFSVETQRIITELNTLSHVFTRTKKREVQEHFPTRSAYKLEIEFSAEERRFYDAVTRWAGELYEETGMPIGFVTANYQRQVASCIWAMGEKLEKTLSTSVATFEDEELTDLDDGIALVADLRSNLDGSPDDSGIAHAEANLGESTQTSSAEEVALSWNAVKLAKKDTKFDLLTSQLREVFAADPNAKVLIFSFFIGTIDYLEGRLSDMEVGGATVGVRKIYGPIPREARYEAINGFRTSSGPQVFLTSEVGAEGLDFQFAACMVNYDLPWNPMRVEQRIGRLDRYGQKSELIEIYNLVINDSIEDRIFYRLYDRIQIFERSIGDLEAILGSEIGDIQRDVLTGRLSEDQQVERANQVANAIINLQKEHDEFDEKSKQFIGVDEVFTDRFNDIKEGERYITPVELQGFVERFLTARFPSVKLRRLGDSEADSAASFELVGSEEQAFISFLNDAYHTDPNLSREHHRLLVRLQQGERCALTFDGRRAMVDRTLEFFSIHHPIVRAMVLASADDATTFPTTGRLALASDPTDAGEGKEGLWIFFLYEVSIRGLRDEIDLVAAVVGSDGEIDEDLSERFMAIAKDSRDAAPSGATEELLTDERVDRCSAIARAWAGSHVDRIREEREIIVENAVDTQLESLKLSFGRRCSAIRDQLAEADRQGQDSIVRMRRGQLANVERKYESKVRDLEKRRGVEVSHRIVGAGVLDVSGNSPS